MPEITEAPEAERHSLLRDLDIPPVRDRNPDPEAGPRLAVSAFRLQGMVEFPELGITKAELDKIVESIRSDMMEEGKLLESGYTAEEIGQVSDLLGKIEEETEGRHVTALEVQQLVWLVRDQRMRRGITLGQIETIADKITNFYRERGFILAKAYIPKQEVRDGIVTLTMQLGMLGEVSSMQNDLYDQVVLEKTFNDVLTQPVTSSQIEERLFLINEYPGINVSGFFEPGIQVGDTRLNIKVNNTQRYDVNIRVDNHGVEETGKFRLYADAAINNLSGWGDLAQIGVLQATSPSNTTYYLLRYNTKLFSPRINMDISASTSQFVLDQNDSSALANLDMSGDTSQSTISLLYKLKRSRIASYALGIEHGVIKSDLSLGGSNVDFLDEKIANNSMFYTYDFLDDENKILHQGNVYLTSGEFIYGNEASQKPEFEIFKADYTHLRFFKIPFTDSTSRIVLRSSLQYSPKSLSSLSQFALAGPTRARAYVANQFSVDSGIHIGMEWLFNSPNLFDFNVVSDVTFKQVAQPFIFLDAAYGQRKSLITTEPDQSGQLTDAGLGLRINYRNRLQGNLQFAFPVDYKFKNVDMNTVDDSMKVVFDLQYSFF